MHHLIQITANNCILHSTEYNEAGVYCVIALWWTIRLWFSGVPCWRLYVNHASQRTSLRSLSFELSVIFCVLSRGNNANADSTEDISSPATMSSRNSWRRPRRSCKSCYLPTASRGRSESLQGVQLCSTEWGSACGARGGCCIESESARGVTYVPQTIDPVPATMWSTSPVTFPSYLIKSTRLIDGCTNHWSHLGQVCVVRRSRKESFILLFSYSRKSERFGERDPNLI